MLQNQTIIYKSNNNFLTKINYHLMSSFEDIDCNKYKRITSVTEN